MTISVTICSAWHVHTCEYAEQVQQHPNAPVSSVWNENAECGWGFASR
ncbi:MAG: hypothetical protein AAF702_50460 [Chloroflexota bacterium]